MCLGRIELRLGRLCTLPSGWPGLTTFFDSHFFFKGEKNLWLLILNGRVDVRGNNICKESYGGI